MFCLSIIGKYFVVPMRCAFIILVGLMGTGLLLCPPPALAEGGTTIPPDSDVAVVLSFEGASSHRSVEEMKRETESIFQIGRAHV